MLLFDATARWLRWPHQGSARTTSPQGGGGGAAAAMCPRTTQDDLPWDSMLNRKYRGPPDLGVLVGELPNRHHLRGYRRRRRCRRFLFALPRTTRINHGPPSPLPPPLPVPPTAMAIIISSSRRPPRHASLRRRRRRLLLHRISRPRLCCLHAAVPFAESRAFGQARTDRDRSIDCRSRHGDDARLASSSTESACWSSPSLGVHPQTLPPPGCSPARHRSIAADGQPSVSVSAWYKPLVDPSAHLFWGREMIGFTFYPLD